MPRLKPKDHLTSTSPLSTLQDPTLLKTQALIDGQWVDASGRFDVTDPATGAVLAQVANLGAAQTQIAIDAANRAWPAWRALTAKARATILMKWFHLLMQHADDLARIMTAEQGKPLAEAKGEVGYGASFIEWFAEESRRVYGETVPSARACPRACSTSSPPMANAPSKLARCCAPATWCATCRVRQPAAGAGRGV